MCKLRCLTENECHSLRVAGNYVECRDMVWVSDDFNPEQVWHSRLEGRVEIHTQVKIINSTVCNYALKDGAVVEGVNRLECRGGSTFGNGVRVAPLNENGGREVIITDNLTSQIAYLWTMWRQCGDMVGSFEQIAQEYTQQQLSDIGVVGKGARLTSCGVIRDIYIDGGVEIEGAMLLENGTLLAGAKVGAGVRAKDFIAVEQSCLDSGASIERCFIGERAIVANSFTALDSLIFSSSHLEAGEAVSIFAGPYTVSHHKSSLLIAGAFSFFNAGSGSNQSNHLFKSGAVHQAQHLRGVKFASNAYVMAPAIEGAFTTIIGRNMRHHDTRSLPFSILMGDDVGQSTLIPAANVTSYGTKRDVGKWQQRDRRTIKRDVINYQEYNPYITGMMVAGLNTLHALSEAKADAEVYMYNRVKIKSSMLRRGVQLYNKAIAVSLGEMLSLDGDSGYSCSGEWCDVAGQYVAKSYIDGVIERVVAGELSTFEQISSQFIAFDKSYSHYAKSWALSLFAQLSGVEPHQLSEESIKAAIDSAHRVAEELAGQVERDLLRDFSAEMKSGYGVDSSSEQERDADFNAVRN